MDVTDLKALGDAELEALVRRALDELDSRARMAALPIRISELSDQFRSLGGGQEALNAAVALATPEAK